MRNYLAEYEAAQVMSPQAAVFLGCAMMFGAGIAFLIVAMVS